MIVFGILTGILCILNMASVDAQIQKPTEISHLLKRNKDTTFKNLPDENLSIPELLINNLRK